MAEKRTTTSSKNTTIKKSVKILWYTILGGTAFFLLMLFCAQIGIFGKIPSMQDLENPQANLATEIYANDGVTMMGKIYAENRSPADFKDISPHIIEALISTEDVRFYKHSGIDAIAIGRAVKGLGSEGGASTLTQQLAKQLLGQGRGNILERSIDKLKEWIVALKLERNFYQAGNNIAIS